MYFIEKFALKLGLDPLMLEGYNISIVAQGKIECHFFCLEWHHALSYLEPLAAIIMNLQHRVKHTPPVSPVHFLPQLRDHFHNRSKITPCIY